MRYEAVRYAGAQTGEFDSRYAIIAIEGNLSLVRAAQCSIVNDSSVWQVIFMAFARLISRYNARDVR